MSENPFNLTPVKEISQMFIAETPKRPVLILYVGKWKKVIRIIIIIIISSSVPTSNRFAPIQQFVKIGPQDQTGANN